MAEKPGRLQCGDKINHKLIPLGVFPPMTILDVKDCETDAARPEPHSQYQVIDPEGSEDWVCAYDVWQAAET